MSVTATSANELSKATRRRAIIAATIGNGLEWFDFTVYSFFAVIIAKLFFPTGNDMTSFLLTVATFGVGFFMRPVGAIVLGVYADRVGRKAALTLTILMMALGTAIIGLAPTYDSIGLWAPALIVLARLIQGFSAGGEVGGATAFLIEHAPTRNVACTPAGSKPARASRSCSVRPWARW
jgi:MHS family proline/betaine transporter-like MFS transporter